jgi:hypothetical protein
MRATSVREVMLTIETLFARKFGTMTLLPSGVNDGMKDRVCTFGSLVPMSTRLTS